MPPQRAPRAHNNLGPLAKLDPSARVVWLPGDLPQMEGAVDNAIQILESLFHPARRNLCLLLPVLEVMLVRVAAAEAVENARPLLQFQADQQRSECLAEISKRLHYMCVAVRELMLQVQVDPAALSSVANSDDGISQFNIISNQVLSDCKKLKSNLEDMRRSYRLVVTASNICDMHLARLAAKIDHYSSVNVKFIDHTCVERYLKIKTHVDFAAAVDLTLRDAGRSVKHDAPSHMLCLSSVVFPADVVPVAPAAVVGRPKEEQEPRMIFQLICESGCIDLVDRLLHSDWLDCPQMVTANYGQNKFFEDVWTALFISKPREQCYFQHFQPLLTWLCDILRLWPVCETVRFTPGAATGSVGPTLAQVEAVLPKDFVFRNQLRVDRGVVTLPLMPTGDFEIRIAGSSGRDNHFKGGLGMILTYRVRYTALCSAPWRLIVGQQSSGSDYVGGGGGGSFLFLGEELLLAAGGGSGGVSSSGGMNASHVSPGRGIIANDNGQDSSHSCGTAVGGKGWKEISKYLGTAEIAGSNTAYSFGGGGRGDRTNGYGGGGGGGYSGGNCINRGSNDAGGTSYAHSSAVLVQPPSATNTGSGFIEIKRIS